MRLLLGILLVVHLCGANGSSFQYSIGKLWEGTSAPPEDEVSITLSSSGGTRDIVVEVDAPYHGDPSPKSSPKNPLLGLWDYEVVEVFFLNDDNQYLEVEIGPHGHYIVLLLDGRRNTIRHSLPLKVSAKINGDRWSGKTIIPAAYLPAQVTKFNAYSIHGVGEKRKYMSLYPTDGTTAEPDFHNLSFFQPIDMTSLHPEHISSGDSLLWQTAVQGIVPFVFDRDWKNDEPGLPPTVVTLQGFKGGVEMNYTVPKDNPRREFKYIGIVFESNDGNVLEIKALSNDYEVTLLREEAVLEGRKLPIDSIFEEKETSLSGSLLIPPSYFPAHVRTLNLYSIFGYGEDEMILTLQPITDGAADWRLEISEPDMSNPEHFIPIDIDFLLENNSDQPDIWKERLAPALVPSVVEPVTEKDNGDDNDSIYLFNKEADLETLTETPVEQIGDSLSISASTSPTTITSPTTTTTTTSTTTTTTTTPATTTATAAPRRKQNPKRRRKPDSGYWSPFTPATRRVLPPRPPLHRPPLRFQSHHFNTQFQQPARNPFFRSIDGNDGKFNILPDEHPEAQEKPFQPFKGADKFHDHTKADDGMLSISISDFLLENLPESVVPLLKMTVHSSDDDLAEPTTENVSASQNFVGVDDIATDISYDISSVTEESIFLPPISLSPNSEISIITPTLVSSIPSTPVKPKPSVLLPWGGLPSRETQNPIIVSPTTPSSIPSTPVKSKPSVLLPWGGLPRRETQERIIVSPTTPSTTIAVATTSTTAAATSTASTSSSSTRAKLAVVTKSPKLPPWGGLPSYYSGPKPHPICIGEGLVPNSSRCQVFHECVIEEGEWVMYNWRCMRGRRFDPKTIECIVGIC